MKVKSVSIVDTGNELGDPSDIQVINLMMELR